MMQQHSVLNMGGPSLEVMQIGAAQRKSVRSPVAIDVGAGAGRNSIFLAGLGFSVTAIENDDVYCQAARAAQARTGAEFKLIRTSAENYVPGSAHDLCLLLGILHFLPTASANLLIRRLKLRARAGGAHIITISSANSRYGNTLKSQKHLDSFHRKDIVEAYCDWQTLAYEKYIKRDNHSNGIIDIHPIEKFVLVKPGAQLFDVKPTSLTPRSEQKRIDDALARNDLTTNTLQEIRQLIGTEDFIVMASSSVSQLSLFPSANPAFNLSIAFWGTAKCYFENDILVGHSTYLTTNFHQYASL